MTTNVICMTTYGKKLEDAVAIQVKVELLEHGMTQKDLAEKVGVGRPAMNLYLNGSRSMPMPTFFSVAEAFGISPRELMTRAEARIQ